MNNYMILRKFATDAERTSIEIALGDATFGPDSTYCCIESDLTPADFLLAYKQYEWNHVPCFYWNGYTWTDIKDYDAGDAKPSIGYHLYHDGEYHHGSFPAFKPAANIETIQHLLTLAFGQAYTVVDSLYLDTPPDPDQAGEDEVIF